MRAMTPPRVFTLPRLTRSELWLVPLSSVTLRKSMRSDELFKSAPRLSEPPRKPLRKRLARLLRLKRPRKEEATKR